MSGEVHKTAEAFSYIADIQNGREPYFGLELWFLTSFQGKPVWALNREHLAYLIDYLLSLIHISIFASGWGDGYYPVYFGYDAKGEVCAVYVQFIDIEDSYKEQV